MADSDFKVAVISDIHSNIWALREVMRDIKSRGINNIINLGDSLYGPLAPAETADLLMKHNIMSIRGNEDRILIENNRRRAISETLNYVRRSLSDVHREWLKSLPFTATVGSEYFLCHGTPEKDDEYLIWNIQKHVKTGRKKNDILEMVQAVAEPVILFGHDHMPYILELSDSKLIVNPGSAGLQAYSDDVPHYHVMETGRPQARYCIISDENYSRHVEDISVDYDIKAAARTAEKNGRPDWGHWLRTGRAD